MTEIAIAIIIAIAGACLERVASHPPPPPDPEWEQSVEFERQEWARRAGE